MHSEFDAPTVVPQVSIDERLIIVRRIEIQSSNQNAGRYIDWTILATILYAA
jgi:hypothetical protein